MYWNFEFATLAIYEFIDFVKLDQLLVQAIHDKLLEWIFRCRLPLGNQKRLLGNLIKFDKFLETNTVPHDLAPLIIRIY